MKNWSVVDSRLWTLTLLVSVGELDQACEYLRLGDENVACVYGVINRDKRAPAAGAGDTLSRFNHKECAVISALNHAATAIEELVCNPFECNADMRAAILVEMNFALLFDRKNFTTSQIETLATSLRDISKGA